MIWMLSNLYVQICLPKFPTLYCIWGFYTIRNFFTIFCCGSHSYCYFNFYTYFYSILFWIFIYMFFVILLPALIFILQVYFVCLLIIEWVMGYIYFYFHTCSKSSLESLYPFPYLSCTLSSGTVSLVTVPVNQV